LRLRAFAVKNPVNKKKIHREDAIKRFFAPSRLCGKKPCEAGIVKNFNEPDL
jgi:hypothetical protein